MASPYWNEPLPPQYSWGTSGFSNLTTYAAQQPAAYAASAAPGSLSIAPVVATYATAPQRQAMIAGALPEDQEQYKSGVVVGSATRYYPVRKGGIGMVTSLMQSAAQTSAVVVNDWHTVGVLRQGGTVWIHDPTYAMNSESRLPLIPGIANVTRLIDSNGFGVVSQIQVQGYSSTNQDCMGRCAQWVDNVLGVMNATNPYPPNTFIAGQLTPGWQIIQRY